MKSLFIVLMLLLSAFIYADEHEHEQEHEEKRSNVGPDKGVTEADDEQGFVIKPKVEVNFAIQRQKVAKAAIIWVPRGALLFSGIERHVYRSRNNFWKAVDVTIVKQKDDGYQISSKELAAGDDIAVSGVGFLKIIEQSVFGPAIEGHVH